MRDICLCLVMTAAPRAVIDSIPLDVSVPLHCTQYWPPLHCTAQYTRVYCTALNIILNSTALH